MSTKNNIEKLFQDQFSDYQLEPSDKLWGKLSRKLKWKTFMRPRWDNFNIAYLGGIILVSSISFFSIINTIDPTLKTEQALIEASDIGSELKTDDINSGNDDLNEISSKKKSNLPLGATKSSKIGIENVEALNSTSTSDKNKTITEPSNSDVTNKQNETKNPNLTATIQIPPRAYFSPSLSEGCAHLQLVFTNLSTDAISYNWSFGDGGMSTDENPTYIFDEPGDYFVSLTAKNSMDEISIHRELIKVYAVPNIQFSIDKTANNTNEFPVYFYNYTKGAESFSWDFGDGTNSDAADPIHIYSTPGEYNVKLIASSIEGCTDSLVLSNILQNKKAIIKLPNAFCPNPSGPNGGYYSNGENTNDVFHPYLEEIPVEYKLKLFNRKGNLLFESSDINIGWDGYYMQKLQPQGVYIYKLRVTFENGESIVKMGDVTLFMR